jgi:hypothetical protein
MVNLLSLGHDWIWGFQRWQGQVLLDPFLEDLQSAVHDGDTVPQS